MSELAKIVGLVVGLLVAVVDNEELALCPHDPQKLALLRISAPQLGHFMLLPAFFYTDTMFGLYLVNAFCVVYLLVDCLIKIEKSTF